MEVVLPSVCQKSKGWLSPLGPGKLDRWVFGYGGSAEKSSAQSCLVCMYEFQWTPRTSQGFIVRPPVPRVFQALTSNGKPNQGIRVALCGVSRGCGWQRRSEFSFSAAQFTVAPIVDQSLTHHSSTRETGGPFLARLPFDLFFSDENMARGDSG